MGNLIRQHIPDKNGNALPENVAMGSYEVRELTHKGIGSLFEGKVVYDKTYGHVTYGCASCCAEKLIRLFYNPLGIPNAGTAGQGVQATDTCTGHLLDISSDFDFSWTTANHAIATVDAYGTHTGQSEGTTSTLTCAQEQIEYRNSCPVVNYCPGGQDNTKPKITGPTTLWWFGGQNPDSTDYPISITLSIAGTGGTWSVTSGSARINLSTTSGTNTTLTPTGTHFSGAPSDTCLTITVSGQTSDQFCITVRTPWKLVSNPAFSGTQSDPTHGYQTVIAYDLHDNLNTIISPDIFWNEVVGTAQNENGSNWATCCGPINVSGGSTGPLQDILQPPTINSSPTPPSPTPTYNNPPSGATMYRQASQTIRVGTATSGSGVLVQSDNLTYWIDHGTHENIVTPTQPPQ